MLVVFEVCLARREQRYVARDATVQQAARRDERPPVPRQGGVRVGARSMRYYKARREHPVCTAATWPLLSLYAHSLSLTISASAWGLDPPSASGTYELSGAALALGIPWASPGLSCGMTRRIN